MVQKLTKDTIKQSTKPVIIKAFATWCPHCNKMQPIFEELSNELSQYIFTEFDIDKDKELTSEFKIESLPTFIFIKDKKEIKRMMGEISKDDLKKLIQENLS